jgi:hypothetical protein
MDPEASRRNASLDGGGGGDIGDGSRGDVKPRTLPDDLPTSLDDRRSPAFVVGETEMYDGWQGELCWSRLLEVRLCCDSGCNCFRGSPL